MEAFRRIVLGVEVLPGGGVLSRGTKAAVRQARWLAETTGGSVTVFHSRHGWEGDAAGADSVVEGVVKDLAVDRSAFDQIIQAGGYVSVNTGGAPDGNAIPIPQENAELAMDAAACIGCGACVAACPNASAMLFTGAKISHLALLPQGKPETAKRALGMLRILDELGFGNCGYETECVKVCPKGISITNIARFNREFLKAGLFSSEK